MQFTKMHGLGNDYLYVYGEPEHPAEWSVKLSNRHFGAGSDGMIWICPSEIADFKMRIFNADGSEAKMCGNGIRCVGKYVYDKGYTDKTHLEIETLSGIRTLDLHLSDGIVENVSVYMGKAVLSDPEDLDVDGTFVNCNPVSVGNPHAVIFVDDIETAPLTTLGPKLEHHEAFPGGVNVEFVQKTGKNGLRMRVWERGSGVTMACGTGACAVCVAAVENGFAPRDEEVTVKLRGGDLVIRYCLDSSVKMTGPATFVFDGELI